MADELEKDRQNALYIRLVPAFLNKIKEWERAKFYNVKVSDLWNYCVINKWRGKNDLHLCEMVDDILHIDITDFIEFIRKDRND